MYPKGNSLLGCHGRTVTENRTVIPGLIRNLRLFLTPEFFNLGRNISVNHKYECAIETI